MPKLAGTVAEAFETQVREHEERWLAPLAVRSYDTRGRMREEDVCRLRTPFQRDRDRILHSKPFRRLKGKTQVFIDPAGDHYRTRMTHTLETTAIARGVARALRLNEDLVEAIGLGHDMGHTPFGHAGEEALDEALQAHFGRRFRHNEHSLLIAEALNLTAEVRDGILTHTGEREPATLEGKIVRIVDRVAYINHDIDDAVRFGILDPADLPQDEVAAVADIVAVVSARTQLRKTGGRYLGRCPFHEERTPSFSVNSTDKLYYCFGCGAKGDLITFVRETEQLDFAGAIEWLADRFNVRVEYEELSPQQDARRRRRDRLLSLLEAAATFYERYLWDSPAGSLARDYLAGRGLGEEVCREYRLGLALGGTTLSRKAHERGFTRDELLAAGLANRRGNDYFSGRLLFPLADARGRVLGFQARKLREDDPLRAKYVNSPEGELFRKGDLLYGLDRARAAIAKQERAVVVEGNTDVLALRQGGIAPVA